MADIRKTLNKLSRQMEKQASPSAAAEQPAIQAAEPKSSDQPEIQQEKVDAPTEE